MVKGISKGPPSIFRKVLLNNKNKYFSFNISSNYNEYTNAAIFYLRKVLLVYTCRILNFIIANKINIRPMFFRTYKYIQQASMVHIPNIMYYIDYLSSLNQTLLTGQFNRFTQMFVQWKRFNTNRVNAKIILGILWSINVICLCAEIWKTMKMPEVKHTLKAGSTFSPE